MKPETILILITILAILKTLSTLARIGNLLLKQQSIFEEDEYRESQKEEIVYTFAK